MNSVHDMGGMHGLGPIAPEQDEPVFHAPWEGRAVGLALAAWAWNADAWRHAQERIPGLDYLRMSYYERWTTALETLLVETGLVSRQEIEARQAAAGVPSVAPPPPAVPEPLPAVQDGAPPHFALGEAVRARNINPTGHTRLPRYARGRPGVITADHGAHVFPDANAHGLGKQPQRLYQVQFAAQDLWGAAARADDAVFIDLWESYLVPA